MNILIAAKLNQDKLNTLLAPLICKQNVKHIYLVRRYPVKLDKVRCYCPPVFLRRFKVTSEAYRFCAIIYLSLFKDIQYLIGIYFYFHCVFVGIAALIVRKPFVCWIIEDPLLYKTKKVFSYFIRKASHILVRGSYSKNFLIKEIGLNKENITVMPDVYKTVSGQLEALEKLYDLVFVGDLVQEKRVDVLLSVMSEVVKNNPEVRLAIVGRGFLKEKLINQMIGLGLDKNVDFLGFVYDVRAVLKEAKIFIMTSETEGLPMVLYEAAECGLPLIVPDVGDVCDIAVDQENALVVPKLNVQAFTEACLQLINDKSLYEKLSHGMIGMRDKNRRSMDIDHIIQLWTGILK